MITCITSVQLRQPVQMWKTGLLSELKEEQLLAKEASSRIDYIHGHAHLYITRQPEQVSAHQLSHSTAAHKRNVQSATEMSRLSQATSHSYRSQTDRSRSSGRLSSEKPLRLSSSKLDKSPLRPSSSNTKLKGRLGDLVAAIAEAHRASSTSLSTTILKDDHKSGSLPPTAKQQVWKDTCRTPSSSSLESVEVHICDRCDRMYYDRVELEKHYTLCQI